MLVRILVGAFIGGFIGLGANYLCIMTGGACPLVNSRLIAVILFALLGGMFGASFRKNK